MILVLAGCSFDTPEIDAPLSRNVGTIVEVPGTVIDQLPQWRFTAEPARTFGGSDQGEDYSFNQIKAATRLANGETLIVDGRTSDLRVFDQKSRILRKFDSPRGPSGRAADIMWDGVSPSEGGRISVIYASNRLIHVIDLQRGDSVAAEFPDLMFPRTRRKIAAEGDFTLLGVFPDGSVVAQGTLPPVKRREVEFSVLEQRNPRTRTYALFRGGLFQELESLPTATTIHFQYEPEGTIWRGWGSEALYAARGIARLGADGVIFGRTDQYEIRHWSRTGLAIKTLRVLRDPIPVTNEVIAVHRAWVDTSRTAEEPARDYLRNLQPGGSMPYFGDLFLDREGRIWVENYRSSVKFGPRLPRQWVVFSEEGIPIAQIDEAFTGRILELGLDYVLVAGRDSKGAEVVNEYRLDQIER